MPLMNNRRDKKTDAKAWQLNGHKIRADTGGNRPPNCQVALSAKMRNATPPTTKSRIEIHAREMHAYEIRAIR